MTTYGRAAATAAPPSGLKLQNSSRRHIVSVSGVLLHKSEVVTEMNQNMNQVNQVFLSLVQ